MSNKLVKITPGKFSEDQQAVKEVSVDTRLLLPAVALFEKYMRGVIHQTAGINRWEEDEQGLTVLNTRRSAYEQPNTTISVTTEGVTASEFNALRSLINSLGHHVRDRLNEVVDRDHRIEPPLTYEDPLAKTAEGEVVEAEIVEEHKQLEK